MDVMTELEQLGPWYHTIDLGDGTQTPGKSDVSSKFDVMLPHLPSSLHGLRVLDLGCNAGGIAVEFAKRGASVVGVEAVHTYHRQACWVRDRLGLDIEYRMMSIYDIGELDGVFDVVTFLGLIYHLRHPQLAIDLLATQCVGTLIMNTPIVSTPAPVMEMRIAAEPERIDQAGESRHNWWFPSPTALHRMLAVAGFSDIVEFHRSEKPFVSSNKSGDNSSAYPTGSVYVRAAGHGDGSVPVAMSTT